MKLGNDVKIISKLHDKCKKCEHKDKCNEKRMVACGLMKLPSKARVDIKTPALEPMARQCTPITINMSDNGTISTSLEEIKKNIEEDFYKQLKCDFMR